MTLVDEARDSGICAPPDFISRHAWPLRVLRNQDPFCRPTGGVGPPWRTKVKIVRDMPQAPHETVFTSRWWQRWRLWRWRWYGEGGDGGEGDGDGGAAAAAAAATVRVLG